ncbi:MAG: fibronectin type III domain-containing protein [Candidatus Levybacteria bacterium]|nr:fibronectin type III domain-containing protein [Candidatus Levybacteria bacterium]
MRDIWARRIPTLLGIFLISIGIGITTFLVNQGTIFRIGAAPSNTPKNINITNISQTSFTVSWLTDEKVIGSINFGETKELGQTALDERDQLSKDLQVYNVHSVTIQNLSPSTNYYFSITSK